MVRSEGVLEVRSERQGALGADQRDIMSRPVRSLVTREADECSLVLIVDKGS